MNNNYRILEVNNGKSEKIFAKVPEEMFDYLNQFKWKYKGGVKSKRRVCRIASKEEVAIGLPKYISLHRQILNFPDYDIDHKDGDHLNNTLENLRPATSTENSYNRKKKVGTSSKYKGVSYMKAAKKWIAYIVHNKKRITLGLFENEEIAAKVRDGAALALHKEFAVLNFSESEAIPFFVE